MATQDTLPAPLGLLAELTHRCPLGCPYCSNPLALDNRADELDTATWARVFREAAALGVLQVHLSGGEPAARRDLADIVKAAREASLYSNLITSAVGLTPQTLAALADAGLDHVQISIQDSEQKSADHIAGYDGASARKRALAAEVVKLGLPLTVNMVVHRANIVRIEPMVELALSLGATRVEIAHVQYYGWALKNRATLMPSREQVDAGGAPGRGTAPTPPRQASSSTRWCRIITRASPSPASAAGAAARSMSRRPARVLPCHAAEVIPELQFWTVREHSLADIWRSSPAFMAFRGTDWMQEPCKSCERREQDFGGCRCQAFLIAGDVRAADPVCHLSPHHALVEQLAAVRDESPYSYRHS